MVVPPRIRECAITVRCAGAGAASVPTRNRARPRRRACGRRVVRTRARSRATAAVRAAGPADRACRTRSAGAVRRYGPRAQLGGDLGVVETPRCQPEHVELPRGEHAGEFGSGRSAWVSCGRGQEGGDLTEQHRPRRLVRQHDVVLALQRHQPGTPGMGARGSGCARSRSSGRSGCAAPTWADRVPEARGRDVGELRCDRASSAVSAWSPSAAARPASFIWASVAPGIISLVNTRRNSGVGRSQPTWMRAWKALSSSCSSSRSLRRRGRVAAVEHQPGDPLRMPARVLQGPGPPCAMASRAKRPRPASSRPPPGPRPGPRGCGRPPRGRRARGRVVVPDHRGDPPELHQVVPPHGALPVELEMTQPARVDEQRGSRTVDCVRDPTRRRSERSGCPARSLRCPRPCQRW